MTAIARVLRGNPSFDLNYKRFVTDIQTPNFLYTFLNGWPDGVEICEANIVNIMEAVQEIGGLISVDSVYPKHLERQEALVFIWSQVVTFLLVHVRFVHLYFITIKDASRLTSPCGLLLIFTTILSAILLIIS